MLTLKPQARLACTTAWIASPAETVALLDEIEDFTLELERTKHSSTNATTHNIPTSPPSRPDQPKLADTSARELLGAPAIPTDGTNDKKFVTDANDASVPPIENGDVPTSKAPSISAYEADTDSATKRSETPNIRSGVLQERPNGSVHDSIATATTAFGMGPKLNVPTTSAEQSKWIAEVGGRIGKFKGGRYGAPKTGQAGSDTASNAGGWGAASNSGGHAASNTGGEAGWSNAGESAGAEQAVSLTSNAGGEAASTEELSW